MREISSFSLQFDYSFKESLNEFYIDYLFVLIILLLNYSLQNVTSGHCFRIRYIFQYFILIEII